MKVRSESIVPRVERNGMNCYWNLVLIKTLSDGTKVLVGDRDMKVITSDEFNKMFDNWDEYMRFLNGECNPND